MFRRLDPASVAKPASAYAHGVEVPAGCRTLYLSGQVPVRPDGTVPDDFAGQYRQVWGNIRNILAEGAMALEDIIRMTTFVTSPDSSIRRATPATRSSRACASRPPWWSCQRWPARCSWLKSK